MNHRFKKLMDRLYTGIISCMLFCTFVFPVRVYAKDSPVTLPNLATFIETVKNGDAGALRGVYIQNVIALPVVQQPGGDNIFVSTDPAVVTQFNLAARAGNVGLLAHNYLAGQYFFNINPGDQIILVYGDGHLDNFEVENILRFQALDPLNPYSHFKQLGSQTILTSEQLFNKMYLGEHHLTLQTCFENQGNLSWGRLFIIAKPIDEQDVNVGVYPTLISNIENFSVNYPP